MKCPLRLIAAGLLAYSLLTLVAVAQPGAIDDRLLARFEQQVAQRGDAARTINAATNNTIKDLSLNRSIITNVDKQFNVKVKTTGIINQRSSGRCWMFAGANAVTPKVMTKLKLSDFDLSQSYLALYDKLEKSNMFLEEMIRLADQPLSDRSLQMYLDDPIGDGGWWHYFADLIAKYGIVPASVMPESKQSASTGQINGLINTKLRQSAARLRTMNSAGKKVEDLRLAKEAMLADIYRLLVYTYGVPPKEFTFRYEEGEDSAKVLVEKTYTPHSFYDEFFGSEMPEYIAISNNPAQEYGKVYEMIEGRNVMERPDMRVLNAEIGALKRYALEAILDSQIVWFACDVGRDNFNDSGLFAVNVYDYNTTFDMSFDIPKADRIRYKAMSPNHAMVLTGVDTTDAGVPRKWLVENSWGDKRGDKGTWTMLDNWFDENVLLVIVDKKLLSAEDQKAWEQKPVMVADWEPFFMALQRLE
jgi:bleomycin hydrolase